MVSRIKERLLQYKQELQKQTMYKEGLPGSSRDFATKTEIKSGKMILSNIISEKTMLQSNMDAIKIVLILRKQNMSDSM